MTTDLTNKTVKCRKEHKCEWCAEKILSNESALYRTYLFDGEFNSEHFHPECYEALQNSDLGYDNVFYPMTQKRGEVYDENLT
jgi:hypothetical protein